MGMLDEKEYLTGQNGLVKAGDTFQILDAGMGGFVTIGGKSQQECWLKIRRAGEAETHTAYTTGVAIVGQVQRMDGEDRRAMQAGQFIVRMGQVDTGRGNPAFRLESPTATQAEQQQGQFNG